LRYSWGMEGMARFMGRREGERSLFEAGTVNLTIHAGSIPGFYHAGF
jgi:hypothetical protein